MKGIKRIVDLTNKINQKDKSTWVTLYYSFDTDSVYSDPRPGAYRICELINPNTRKDIIDTVEWWKRL